MFSTMITVASTTRPKSMAPTDSRFADSPRSTMSPIAKDSANGMVMPTMMALRRLPRNAHCSRKISSDAGDHVVQHRVGGDVDQVAAIVDALDAARRAAGCRDALILSTSASTRLMVGMLCAPRRMSTMPCTMSSTSS